MSFYIEQDGKVIEVPREVESGARSGSIDKWLKAQAKAAKKDEPPKEAD